VAASRAPEEVHLPFPAPTKDLVPLATQFRSTWLTSSVRAIKDRGRWDEYLSYLPGQHHQAIEDTVAGTWLPSEVAVAHYEACDKLHFTQLELIAIGRDVHDHANASVLSLLVKLAGGAGVTPWNAFSQFNRLWSRVWVGGGVGVFRLGPKEARMEIVGWACSRSTYIRHAFRGVTVAMLEMFCTKAYVQDLPAYCTASTLGYRCAWA
jgi:hypothetical protein